MRVSALAGSSASSARSHAAACSSLPIERNRSFSLQDIRRTFVWKLLDTGAVMLAVQKLARRASVDTTARCDRCGDEVRRKAIGLLHVSFTSRGHQRG